MNSMPSPPDSEVSCEALMLPANGDTASAQDLHAQLIARFDREDPVEIDASAIEHIGQAVLQLLVAACNEARAADRQITFTNPSPAFRECVERCGLNDKIEFEPSGANA